MKRSNRGLTLIELIVTVAIASMIIVSAMSFLVAVTRMYARSKQEVDLQNEVQRVMNIVDDLLMESSGDVDFGSGEKISIERPDTGSTDEIEWDGSSKLTLNGDLIAEYVTGFSAGVDPNVETKMYIYVKMENKERSFEKTHYVYSRNSLNASHLLHITDPSGTPTPSVTGGATSTPSPTTPPAGPGGGGSTSTPTPTTAPTSTPTSTPTPTTPPAGPGGGGSTSTPTPTTPPAGPGAGTPYSDYSSEILDWGTPVYKIAGSSGTKSNIRITFSEPITALGSTWNFDSATVNGNTIDIYGFSSQSGLFIYNTGSITSVTTI